MSYRGHSMSTGTITSEIVLKHFPSSNTFTVYNIQYIQLLAYEVNRIWVIHVQLAMLSIPSYRTTKEIIFKQFNNSLLYVHL